jgi:hypothetical protein
MDGIFQGGERVVSGSDSASVSVESIITLGVTDINMYSCAVGKFDYQLFELFAQ